jgi:pimeloyl-ACP methyl ester carboxylesterase
MVSNKVETTPRTTMSADGTRIGYLQRGAGPGLVLVQGAMGAAYHYDDLAQALASDFTVYTPDRRGRGLSPKPYNSAHTIARDVEDVDAVLAETGASRVFGLSSGAMITLEAARTLPRVTKASVYEPPFYPNGIDLEGIRQFNLEIDRGDFASGFVSAGRIVGLAPPPVRVLPKPIARLLTGAVIRGDDRQTEPYEKMRDLLRGMPYDFNDVSGMQGTMNEMATIEKPMLLLSGTRSPAYLRQSVASLDLVLPQSQHIEFVGLDHSGAWNRGRGGHPETVANALREFFA